MFELMRAIRIDGDLGQARGRAHVAADHPMFADHFRGIPIVPGTMLVELAAQVAGPLAEELTLLRHGVERWAVLGMIRSAALSRPCMLPATVELHAEVTRADPSYVTVRVEAAAGEEHQLRAELVMMMIAAQPEWHAAIDERRARVARWKAAW